MQARQDEVRQWERDWRQDITKSLETTAKIAGDTALVVREMQGDVRELMEWKASLDRRRDGLDDKRPDMQRSNLALAVSFATFVVYLLTLLSQHWKP